jgi:hypothetical protein
MMVHWMVMAEYSNRNTGTLERGKHFPFNLPHIRVPFCDLLLHFLVFYLSMFTLCLGHKVCPSLFPLLCGCSLYFYYVGTLCFVVFNNM